MDRNQMMCDSSSNFVDGIQLCFEPRPSDNKRSYRIDCNEIMMTRMIATTIIDHCGRNIIPLHSPDLTNQGGTGQ